MRSRLEYWRFGSLTNIVFMIKGVWSGRGDLLTKVLGSVGTGLQNILGAMVPY